MESSIGLKWGPTAEEVKKSFELGQETDQKIKA